MVAATRLEDGPSVFEAQVWSKATFCASWHCRSGCLCDLVPWAGRHYKFNVREPKYGKDTMEWDDPGPSTVLYCCSLQIGTIWWNAQPAWSLSKTWSLKHHRDFILAYEEVPQCGSHSPCLPMRGEQVKCLCATVWSVKEQVLGKQARQI